MSEELHRVLCCDGLHHQRQAQSKYVCFHDLDGLFAQQYEKLHGRMMEVQHFEVLMNVPLYSITQAEDRLSIAQI
jgi:hypothetical protein